MKTLSVLCASLLLSGCEGFTPTETTTDMLSASATADSLFVTNRSAEPLYLFIVDSEELALMSYALCQTRQQCGPGLAPGITLRRSLSGLDGSDDGVRNVSIDARVFRIQNGVETPVHVGSLLVAIPQ